MNRLCLLARSCHSPPGGEPSHGSSFTVLLAPEGSLVRRPGGGQTFKCKKGASPIHNPCDSSLNECTHVFHSTEGSRKCESGQTSPVGSWDQDEGQMKGREGKLSFVLAFSPNLYTGFGTSDGDGKGLAVGVWPQLAWPET